MTHYEPRFYCPKCGRRIEMSNHCIHCDEEIIISLGVKTEDKMIKREELSKKEVIDEFINGIKRDIKTILSYEGKTEKEKLELLAFSILVTIDGESGSSPAFILAPAPHEDDKDFRIKNKRKWYPENLNFDVSCDISGDLHNKFNNACKKSR